MQLADTGLADYTARAHGYVTFLAQLGDGFPLPPAVIKSDELMLEVETWIESEMHRLDPEAYPVSPGL